MTDYQQWLTDVQQCVRVKDPMFWIQDVEHDYPLAQMYDDDWSAGDAASEIINKVEY